MLTVTTWTWMVAQASGGDAFDLGSLIPVLGVSVVFIYVWLITTKELKAANAALIANELKHSEQMVESEQAHSAQLLELVNRIAPVLESASKTLGAMEKGAAHVAEKVATSHSDEYRGLREELHRVVKALDEKGP